MKRAATHLFKKQSKNRAFFQNYQTFTLIEDPWGKPWTDPQARQKRKPDPRGK